LKLSNAHDGDYDDVHMLPLSHLFDLQRGH